MRRSAVACHSLPPAAAAAALGFGVAPPRALQALTMAAAATTFPPPGTCLPPCHRRRRSSLCSSVSSAASSASAATTALAVEEARRGRKQLAMEPPLYDYLLANVREHPLLRDLREETAAMRGSQMQVSPAQAQLLAMLVQILGAQRCIEVGIFTGAISLGRQLDYFKEYQSKVAAVAGNSHAVALTSGSIYVVSAGTSDYVQNYYVNAMLAAAYTPDQFGDALMTPYTAFVKVTESKNAEAACMLLLELYVRAGCPCCRPEGEAELRAEARVAALSWRGQDIPESGRLVACERDDRCLEVAKRYYRLAGVAHKVDVKHALAVDSLKSLLESGEASSYDFAFVDADKKMYEEYFELLLKLVRVGGLIVMDNVLWYGRVADPLVNDSKTVSIRNFNKKLLEDERVNISMVPIGDGMTICRKLEED